MSLAEGVSARITAKFYASGVMASNALADIATAPGASGGQVIRRVASTLKLAKDSYQSGEVRNDRQIADFRHGTRRVTGKVLTDVVAPERGILLGVGQRDRVPARRQAQGRAAEHGRD